MTVLDAERLEAIRLTRDSAAAIAPPDGDLSRVRRLRYGTPDFDLGVWREMASLGWIGLRLPEARGGVGMGLSESIALYEALGAGLVPEPLIAATLGAEALAATGEDGLLERVLAGESLVPLAWQAAPDALGVAADAGLIRLNVPMHGAASHVLVAAVGPAGETRLTLFPIQAVQSMRVPRQDGSAVAHCTVDPEAGQPVATDAQDAIARAIDAAALGTASYLLGVAERAFAITLDYLKQRTQFGQSLAAFQALQHRAADMKIQLTLARASVEGAALEFDAGVGPARRAAVVSRAKARAADTALLVGREAIQMHGAIGYADEADIGLFTRKAMVVANEYGSAMAHRRRFMRLAG